MRDWAKIFITDSRAMPEVADGSIDLVVTSPPYWHIKDYGAAGQIGFGQSLHEYFRDLYRVWAECHRALRPGARLCLNIGDQFARARDYGRYKVIPLHAEFIAQCEQIGFDFLGAIIWQKKTTMNTTGGAPLMGSYPYPPNGLVEIDYEFILIFKKPGPGKKVPPEVKAASRLTKEEWKEYFAGHWHFAGARQLGHEAMFPGELPRRLIRMFTFQGDTVLDPFLGSGTTVKAALELNRRAVGYEISEDFLEIIEEKLGLKGKMRFEENISLSRAHKRIVNLPEIDYIPSIQDARPQTGPRVANPAPLLARVSKIVDEKTVKLADGRTLTFLGVCIDQREKAVQYLQNYLLGKDVIAKFDPQAGRHAAYIFLKNKLFINAYLIKSGLGSPDLSLNHRHRNKFIQLYTKKEP